MDDDSGARLNEELRATLAELRQIISQLREDLAKRDAENAELKRMLFGKRSERVVPIEREIKKATPETAPARQAATKERRTARARQKRELPEVEIVHPVSPAAEHCSRCGGNFRDLGDGDVSSEYEFVPGRFIRRKHIRKKRVCQCGCTIISADPPDRVADGVQYGAGLHAHVVVSKCCDSIPLYRQAKSLQRQGVPISDSSLGDMFHRAAEICRPLYDILLREIAASGYVNADETPLPVQSTGKTRRAFIWTFIGAGHVAFSFSPSRSGSTPASILAGNTGFLQVDAYGGYNGVCTPERWVRVGCLAHVRRYFFKAKETAPEAAQDALSRILSIYRVEYEAETLGIVGTDAHLELRQRKAKPILEAFQTWILQQQTAHTPKSPMGKAITYALNAWPTLLVYLSDAKLRPDNNAAERQLRAIALGRKNFLFVGSDVAGENLAVLQSLVATCCAHDVNPHSYLTDVLVRSRSHPASRARELLPDQWKRLFGGDAPSTT